MNEPQRLGIPPLESLKGAGFYAQDLIRIIRVCSGGRHGQRAKHRHSYAKPGYGNTDRHVHYAIAAGDNNPAWRYDNAAKLSGNSAYVSARLKFHRNSGSYTRHTRRCRQRWIGNRHGTESDGDNNHRGSVHAIQQHQHWHLRFFDYDHSEQHDLNNSEQLNFNNSQYIEHRQRHGEQFQLNRSFSNSVAPQRDLGYGSEPMHTGQQHKSSGNSADQSATAE